MKCSGERPSCESCLQLSITCVYNAVTKKRGKIQNIYLYNYLVYYYCYHYYLTYYYYYYYYYYYRCLNLLLLFKLYIGPRSGYIEEIVSSRVQKEFEKYVTESLISKKNILILAKNNEEMFKSSEVLKKYLEEVKNKEKVENIENEIFNSNSESNNDNIIIKTEDVTKKEILSSISKNKKNEVFIVNTLNKLDNIGNASLIYNYPYVLDYNLISIDYDLINTYFRYSHFYCPILIKEVFMDRLKRNTILPGLLLAVYASACFYRPHPDLNMSKKYIRLSHIYCSIYYHDSDIQTVQTITLLANCGNYYYYYYYKNYNKSYYKYHIINYFIIKYI